MHDPRNFRKNRKLNLNMDKIVDVVNKFSGKRIGIVGDLMLDRYLFAEVRRISQEAPVPVAKVTGEKYVLGGAANVAANVASLGGAAEVFGLVGDDAKGELMIKILSEQGIECGLSFISSRPTTVKTRLISGNQQIVRVDREEDHNISQMEEERIIKRMPAFLEKVDVVVISDYAKGLVTENVAKEIIHLAAERGMKVLSDPVPETFHKFKNSYLIKPNKGEAEFIAGVKFKKDYSNISEVMGILREKLDSNFVITLGGDGMAVSEGKEVSMVPTVAREVYDVSGAGDTVIATLALGFAAGGDLKTSCLISNYCAGIVVGKIGTSTASSLELIESINKNGVIDYAKAY